MENVRVLVTGVDADITPDVVYLLAAEGVQVTAISGDRAALEGLERTLSLYGVTIKTLAIDPESSQALISLSRELSLAGALPQIVVACGDPIAAETPIRVLRPSLVLYALPTVRSILGQAIECSWRPALPSLIRKGPGKGFFNPRAKAPFVRLGTHLFRCDARPRVAEAINPAAARSAPRIVASR